MPLHRAPCKSSNILQPALPQPRLSPGIALVNLTVGQTTSLSVSLTACTSDATQYIWMTEWYQSGDNDMRKVRVLNTDREQTPDAQPIRQLYGGCPFLFLAINPLIPRCIAPKAETLPFFTAVPVFAAALQMCTCHARQFITACDKADRARTSIVYHIGGDNYKTHPATPPAFAGCCCPVCTLRLPAGLELAAGCGLLPDVFSFRLKAIHGETSAPVPREILQRGESCCTLSNNA